MAASLSQVNMWKSSWICATLALRQVWSWATVASQPMSSLVAVVGSQLLCVVVVPEACATQSFTDFAHAVALTLIMLPAPGVPVVRAANSVQVRRAAGLVQLCHDERND